MTEFKKCTALVADIARITEELENHERVAADIDWTQRVLSQYADDLVPGLQLRMSKLLATAREKDPDRQIYNENMCRKIEELSVETDAACQRFECALPHAHAVVREALTRRVKEQQAAESVAQLAQQEADQRQLIRYDLANAIRDLLKYKDADLLEAIARRQARELREWHEELERRKSELESFETAVRSLFTMGDQPSVGYGKCVAMRFAATLNSDVDLARRIRINLVALLSSILMNPADIGVAKLRNNNATFLAHFGHPLAAPVNPGDADSIAEAQRVRMGYAAAELVMGAAGYRPSYEAGGAARAPVLPQPASWVIPTCPWDRYGERFLLLREPDPVNETDAWVNWRECLNDVYLQLSQMLV